MARTYESDDREQYRMDYKDPHRRLEPLEREVVVVDEALGVLVAEGILPHAEYDHEKMLAHREAVREAFEIPWTAITPRMQRLLYAISAISRPANLIAAGVFCGNTFISNAGAAVGPGACYEAKRLVGVEIDPGRAELAEQNVRRIDPTGVARVLAEDAVETVRGFPDPLDLLYLDADGAPPLGKGIYLEILQAGGDRIRPGCVVLAHNSYNCADDLEQYLTFVRDPANMSASVNVLLDNEGLEVSIR